MRKTIIYSLSALVAGLIISPFIGMAIRSTRELILGLAPEEAVLQLADKIDSDRAGIEQKTSELQSLIDTQNAQLAEQQQIIDQQKVEFEAQKSQSAQTASEVSQMKTQVAEAQQAVKDEAKCRELYAKNTFCNQSGYRSQSGLDQLLNRMKKGEPEAAYQEDKKDVMERFNKCQEIIQQCD